MNTAKRTSNLNEFGILSLCLLLESSTLSTNGVLSHGQSNQRSLGDPWSHALPLKVFLRQLETIIFIVLNYTLFHFNPVNLKTTLEYDFDITFTKINDKC